jgi:hypothetical protein
VESFVTHSQPREEYLQDAKAATVAAMFHLLEIKSRLIFPMVAETIEGETVSTGTNKN